MRSGGSSAGFSPAGIYVTPEGEILIGNPAYPTTQLRPWSPEPYFVTRPAERYEPERRNYYYAVQLEQVKRCMAEFLARL